MLVEVLIDVGVDLFQLVALDFRHVDLDGGVAVRAVLVSKAGRRALAET